jgi:hypothetical protein
VTRIRTSKPSDALPPLLLAGALLLAGCGAAPPPLAAPSTDKDIPRRPDAVVVEPPEAIPPPASRAEAQGVVTLREPLAADAVREIVEQLTDAWKKQSLEALVALLTSDAGPIEGRGHGRGPLVEAWRQRLRTHEYSRLAGTEIVRLDRIERWTYDELGSSDAPARPADMRAGEIYVRVPFEVTHLGSEKLFEDILELVLRREEGHYRIAAYGEVGGS